MLPDIQAANRPNLVALVNGKSGGKQVYAKERIREGREHAKGWDRKGDACCESERGSGLGREESTRNRGRGREMHVVRVK